MRLNELCPFVSHFIIVEFDLNFNLSHHKKFLDLTSPKFNKFREKITHLKLEFRNYDDYYDLQMKKLKQDSFKLHEKFFVKIFDEITIFLKNSNVDFEDIIMFSDVDEIPNMNDLETIRDILIYNPIVLKSHNFIHTTKFYQEHSHFGTQIYNYSMIIRNNAILFKIHKKKLLNDKNLPAEILKNGWHLSHFDNIENVVEKLNYSSGIHGKKFEIEEVTNSIYGLSNIFNSIVNVKFKKTNVDLPININMINQNLDFNAKSFTHLITTEDEILSGEFDSVRLIKFTNDVSTPFEEKIRDNFSKYNLLIPNKKIYESENFFEEYRINDIKLVIQWIEPFDDDTIVIKTKNKLKEFKWSEIKETELYGQL
jgi:hypothetical protein